MKLKQVLLSTVLFLLYITGITGTYAQTTRTIVLQPGASQGKDTYVVSRSNQQANNYGSEDWLRTAIVTPPGGGHTINTLIEMPILDSLQGADSILQATLTFYADPAYSNDDGGMAGGNATGVYAINQSWTESSVNWTSQPTHDLSGAVTIPTNNNYDSIVVDVTSMIRSIIDLGSPFHGFKLSILATSPTRSMVFCSSDHSNSNWHPKATLTFNEAIVTPPTCDDGILNGDETGIDCGGSTCPPCVISQAGWIFPSGTTGDDPIYRNGSVSIGTMDPDTHKLAVNGTIKTKEVIVNQNDWPDYVFDEDYKLPTLEFLQDYIDQSGHLPNMPTQEQVIQEGVMIGGMQKKLLEKIEELTLYLLQQEVRIKQLEDKYELQKELR